MVGEFDRRRRVIVDGLNAMPGRHVRHAEGRVLRVPERLRALREDAGKNGVLKGSAAVCAFLLDEARIATVAGVDFGSDDHIRLSYATGLETIEKGLARMDTAVRSLQG